MTVPDDFAVVMVTAPDRALARRLAKAALEAKLAACANIVPAVESHYWWEGKLESSDEVLLLLKTRQALLAKLERAVQEIHPYDTPEFIALPLTAGSRRYLAWLNDNTEGE
jgi:periplasmic divalent cation tolerance protein